jgi:hypothetical protein
MDPMSLLGGGMDKLPSMSAESSAKGEQRSTNTTQFGSGSFIVGGKSEWEGIVSAFIPVVAIGLVVWLALKR